MAHVLYSAAFMHFYAPYAKHGKNKNADSSRVFEWKRSKAVWYTVYMMNLFKKFMLIFLSVILGAVILILILTNRAKHAELVTGETLLGETSFSAVSVALDRASLTLGFHEGDGVLVKTQNAAVKTETEGGVLTLSGTEAGQDALVTLLLPEGTELASFTAALGFGHLTGETPPAEEMTVSCNVGDISLTLGSVPVKMNCTMGTGDVTLTFPGEEPVLVEAPFAIGGRDFAERFTVSDGAPVRIEVSAGNITLK